MWDGFRVVDVPPSPKLQAQEVGEPVDVSVKATFNGAVPDVGDAVNEATGAAGEGGGVDEPPLAGFSAVRQTATAFAVLKVQVAVPLAPAVAWTRSACSAICPSADSQRSVQPVGAEAPGVELSKPTPPISIALLLAVVTLGPAMLLARYVVFTAVTTLLSRGVVLLTPL